MHLAIDPIYITDRASAYTLPQIERLLVKYRAGLRLGIRKTGIMALAILLLFILLAFITIANIISLFVLLPITIIWEEPLLIILNWAYRTDKSRGNLEKDFANTNRKAIALYRSRQNLREVLFKMGGKLKLLSFGTVWLLKYNDNLITRYLKAFDKIQKDLVSHLPNDKPLIPGWEVREPLEVYRNRSGVYDFMT